MRVLFGGLKKTWKTAHVPQWLTVCLTSSNEYGKFLDLMKWKKRVIPGWQSASCRSSKGCWSSVAKLHILDKASAGNLISRAIFFVITVTTHHDTPSHDFVIFNFTHFFALVGDYIKMTACKVVFPFLKGFDYRTRFFFDWWVILLGLVQYPQEQGNWSAVLVESSSYCGVGRIYLHLERNILVNTPDNCIG